MAYGIPLWNVGFEQAEHLNMINSVSRLLMIISTIRSFTNMAEKRMRKCWN